MKTWLALLAVIFVAVCISNAEAAVSMLSKISVACFDIS